MRHKTRSSSVASEQVGDVLRPLHAAGIGQRMSRLVKVNAVVGAV